MDYFPHDTDASEDEKIDAFRTLHGNDAYAFYFILCERIYRTTDSEMDISNPVIVACLAKKIMVPIERFNELLAAALMLRLFSPDEYDKRGVLTSGGIKQRVRQITDERQRWRKYKKEVIPNSEVIHKIVHSKDEVIPIIHNDNEFSTEKTGVFHVENGGFPRSFHSKVFKDLKDLDLKELNINTHTHNTHAHAPDHAPQPFAYEGSLDVWNALLHYGIKINGFLKFERIRAFQGIIADDLILAAIKESGHQSDAYCLKVLENWNQKGWRKLEDHPKYRPAPTEGGDVIAINRGRTQSQRNDRRNATASAFEEAGKRSRPGKVIYAPRE